MDNKSYDIARGPGLNMLDCCFIQIFSYGKYENARTARSLALDQFWGLQERVHAETGQCADSFAPHEWPQVGSLTIEERTKLACLHPTSAALNFVSATESSYAAHAGPVLQPQPRLAGHG